MKTVSFLRRRKLGKGSTEGVCADLLKNYGREVHVNCNWKDAPPEEDIVIRWGCTSNTGHANNPGQLVINHAKGIHRCSDKKGSRALLQNSGVSVPRSYFHKAFVTEALNRNEFALIGRKATHSQGRDAVVIRNLDELNADDSSEYWSEIIAKDREFRVYCFFGYVIAVAEKIPHDKDALLWNHAQGGSVFNNVRWGQWPIAVMREALKSQQVMNFEVGGVDVMTEGGTPYILEVNSAPSLTTPYRKQIFARAYEWAIRYIEEHNSKPKMRAEVPDTADWKDYILPFIRR